MSSTTSDSPPTLRRPPFEGDDDDENDPDNSSNQGDNAFAWPTHNSYDEQRYSVNLCFLKNAFVLKCFII